MNISDNTPQGQLSSQQFYRQYSANALLPELDWQSIFPHSKLSEAHIKALNTIYQCAVPLALNVFHDLNFDVFAPAAYHPQGLGLFDKLAQQEENFLKFLLLKVKTLTMRHAIKSGYASTRWCCSGFQGLAWSCQTRRKPVRYDSVR